MSKSSMSPNADARLVIGDDAAIQAALVRDGFCILPDVLTKSQVARAKTRLWEVVAELERSGQSTHSHFLDPNAANVRVYDLPEQDPLFLDLLTWPAALAQVHALLGPDPIVSNFTANIARPGAEPMKMHSDMALVLPPPWQECWAMNVIWCLDDIHEANGATRYLPGSHRFTPVRRRPARQRQSDAAVIRSRSRVDHRDGRSPVAFVRDEPDAR